MFVAKGDTLVHQSSYESAVVDLLKVMEGNPWFVDNHWPLNEPHVRQMISDITGNLSTDESSHVLDVGCFNGYISYLVRRMGFRVTGADIHDLADRRELFDASGIAYVSSNFNSLRPFQDVPSNTFDAVILAQVIEHILNHPLGFVSELARITRPGGLLIITTPQPASVMNATRLLRGRWSLWGTADFIRLPKITNGEFISHAEIHYREYLAQELRAMVVDAGYEVMSHRYLGLGAAQGQARWKRMLKANVVVKWLMTKRLFASNQYVLARKRGD